jgi:hypothetical protein
VAEHETVLPARFAQRLFVDGNSARQLVAWSSEARLEDDDGAWFAVEADGSRHRFWQRAYTPPGTVGLELPRALLEALPTAFPANELRWVTNERPSDPDEVRAGLAGRFVLRTQDPVSGASGLRIPQAGALHAVLAHWSTGTTEPATIVLPTGTGKTETMLACSRVSDSSVCSSWCRRTGCGPKSLRCLRATACSLRAGVLDAPLPGLVVGRIEHHFSSVAAMRSFIERCNVIVTTPNALGASSDDVVAALIARCSHLFVDEAHHVSAASWARIRDAFAGKPVLQFTATPYREDGQRLGGRVIYSFPLGRAQALGYFQPISYVSVLALADPDRAVAEAAVARLRADRDRGLDHLIMARVNRIGKARDDVQPIYEELAPEFAPLLLHSHLTKRDRTAALDAIKARRSRIVVCVDMLGEGFDFPELKIAALHDPHRSLGVALQFIGRFARSRSDLGTATAVVARPDPGYDERLRALYAEDSQWDTVIETLTGQALEEVRELDEFEGGFAEGDDDALSIHVLRPKMSAVVYETSCAAWHPERLADRFAPERIVSPLAINPAERVAWMVVEARSGVRWAHLQSLEDVAYHLHVLHWDPERGLLYINTSQLESLHEDLAQTVCGTDVRRVDGLAVYRVLGELQRPTPTNVGVIDLRNRSRRFSMHVGADVYEGFPVAEQQSKSNTNIFVVAYQEGERVTLGAARKGRIWSQQAADSVLEWVQWCRGLGPKLQDASISLDALFRSFVRPEPLEARPELMPLAIDWPWVAYAGVSDSVKLEIEETDGLLIDAELVLSEHSEREAIRFEVRVGDLALPYEAVVEDGALVHRALGAEAHVVRERSEQEALSTYLNREGTTVWFEQEVVIEGSVLYRLQRDRPPIDLDQLVALSWDGVDIRRESQGAERDRGTVQARAAERLVSLADWDVVLDDDGTGEVADLVALKEEGDRVIVHLVHCKVLVRAGGWGARGRPLCGLWPSASERAPPAARRCDGEQLGSARAPTAEAGTVGADGGRRRGAVRVSGRRAQAAARAPRDCSPAGVEQGRRPNAAPGAVGAADVYVSEVAYGAFDVWCSE